MSYRLLDAFRAMFEGKLYKHRDPTQGDKVVVHLYEDLLELGRSKKLIQRTNDHTVVVNPKNRRVGVAARRGDGALGEALPTQTLREEPGFGILRGAIATIEIGAEVKVVAKSMQKQVARVRSDLGHQAEEFRSRGGNPICVAVVGINRAVQYTSVEKDRTYQTTGRSGNKHPFQEAEAAEAKITEYVGPLYDELIILRFLATNVSPFPFSWADEADTVRAYEASLLRISREYESRF